jgi:hypothetical protein
VFQQHICRINIGIGIAPVGSEAAGTGAGKDCLAEAFQDDRDAIQMLACRVDPRAARRSA